MRTSTVVGLSALTSAALVAPVAIVARDHLGSLSADSPLPFGITLPEGSGGSNAAGAQDNRQATSSNSGTETLATSAQARGVVMIDTVTPGGEGAGTGMVLTSDGTVLTNYHVVDGSTQVRVVTSSHQSYVADVVGHDQTHDVAVLKLRHAAQLPTVKLDMDSVKLSEPVTAVGQGDGQGVLYAARGKITDTRTTITANNTSALASSESLKNLLQVDAPIVPGYSGGPLLDADGEVIGIDTAASSDNSLAAYGSHDVPGTTQRSEGFAIPITEAKSIADRILKHQKTATNHLGARASLGIRVLPSSAGATDGGVVVQSVVDGQGADVAGIKAGDVLTHVAGQKVSNSGDLSHIMDQQTPGRRVMATWSDETGQLRRGSITLARSSAN